MKNNFFLEQQDDELLHSVPVRDYISQKIIASESPFLPVSIISRIKVAVINGFVQLLEKVIGSKIYVENDLREFFFIDSRIRNLLLFLVKKGIVSSWERTSCRADLPALTTYRVLMNPVQSSTGMISIPQGNFGEGISTIPSKALIPALAELLERHSLFSCHTETIIWGSYNTLRPKNPVHPELFQYFSKKQIESFSSYKLITSDTKMGWVYSKSLIFGTQCLIPAQLVYILYYEQHPTEPYFFGTTTNGSAASSSYDEALYRALCEAFERDGLLNFWLNKIAPPVIDLDSIPYPHIKEQILKIKNSLLELYILDITTDMEVPVFAAVIVDRHGEIAVSVNTVAGFDIIRTLEKLLDEAVQAIQYSVVAEDVSEMGSSIQTFEQRRYFWSTQDKIPYISFFLQGRKKDFHEIRTIDEMSDIKTKNNKIKVILKNKNYECFVTDVTSHEARIAGLHVIKVIIPQLVPVYFHEKEKPLGVQRLFSFPVMHGYSTILSKEEYINNIPHPFI